VIEVAPRAVNPDACVDHRSDDAHVVPDFEGAWGDSDGTAVWQRCGELIDDAAGDSVAREFGGHCEAHRACTDYEDLRG
jgi:hypothetical protein